MPSGERGIKELTGDEKNRISRWLAHDETLRSYCSNAGADSSSCR
jgi:hypothetical protein